MKASLDTNVIIHFYRAGRQNIMYEVFTDGICIYEQIRKIEMEHHGKDVLPAVDEDISAGKIELYTDEKLKQQCVYSIFVNNVKENRLLYGTGDLGEVYAISLAQTIGAYSLVTDDIKQGGPYMSLLQLEYDVMPFHFADVLILWFLMGFADENRVITEFNVINKASNLNWSLWSQLKKFRNRFMKDPYKEEERDWIEKLAVEYEFDLEEKIRLLGRTLQRE